MAKHPLSRKFRLAKRRRLRARCLRIASKRPRAWDDRRVNRYNRAVTLLHTKLYDPRMDRFPRLDASTECAICGKEVLLFSDSCGWTREGRRWGVTDYGPACGFCCEHMYADDGWEDCVRVYDLRPRAGYDIGRVATV